MKKILFLYLTGWTLLIHLILNSASVDANNQCGGFRKLNGEVGQICEVLDAEGDCRKGIFQCLGKNNLLCASICGTNSMGKGVINDVYDTLKKMDPSIGLRDTIPVLDCGENGYPNRAKTECICNPGYRGQICDEIDVCFRINCGYHGVCQTNGTCKCDPGFSGDRCEINSICDPGGLWNPKTNHCKCRMGWVGDLCNQCSNDTLCTPKQKGEVEIKTYVLGFFNDELRTHMLLNPLLPGYTYTPVIPGTDNLDCSCNYIAPSLNGTNQTDTSSFTSDSQILEGQFFDWGRMAPTDDDSDDFDSDPNNCVCDDGWENWNADGFSGDFFNHHFEPRGNHDHVYWLGGFGWLLLIVFLIFFCWCFNPFIADGAYSYSSPRPAPQNVVSINKSNVNSTYPSVSDSPQYPPGTFNASNIHHILIPQ